MKRFIINIFFIFFLTYIFGELITRILGFRSQNMDFQVKGFENNYSNQANSEGNFVFGKPPSLYKTKFRYNDIGFNTPLDLKDYNENKINVAFLGDSFVESLHVNYYESFSSILMAESDDIQSYEFGFHEYNIEDYIWLYDIYNLEKFDYVFVIFDINDIQSNPNRLVYNQEKERFRDIYNKFHFFNFLNRNHNLIRNFKKMIYGNSDTIKSSKNIILENHHKKFLKKENLFVIPRDNVSFKFFEENKIKNSIKIDFNLKQIDFGKMDEHWNVKGRRMVIKSLMPYIDYKN